MLNKKRTIIGIILSLLLIVGGYALWQSWGAQTKIALVNFPGYQSSGIILSNKSSHIKYDKLEQNDIDKFDDYDCVLVFGMGIKWTEEQRAQVRKLADSHLPLQVIYAVTAENAIESTDSVQSQRILEYVDGGNRQNYQSLAYYIRKYVDKKKWFAPEPSEWVDSPTDVFYHIDENVGISEVTEFEAYLKKNGYYHPNAPKVVITGGLNNPFGGSKENLDSLIVSLDRAGLNVYPISSMMGRMEMIEQVEPDLIIYMPHGRLLMGQGERAVEYLREKNIPMLTALTIFKSNEEWEKDPMGLVGGFMSQTIGMPELDGAIYPYALFTQEVNEDGYEVVRAVPERLKTFTSIVQRFISLKHKANQDKHIAIYFYKGPGQEGLLAQGLETVPSLYNLLLRLRSEGYDLTGLPSTVEQFRADLSAQAKVFEPYAHGSVNQYPKVGNPALVSADTLKQWLGRGISKPLVEQLAASYGEAPGEYLSIAGDKGDKQLIVSRLQYGNVAILPQPMAGIGEDGFAIIHGANMPPPYPYVGSYLWSRYAFGADAIMHFGTHGSLEFTPKKQVALGQTDWGDQLMADIPHFYYYTIGNIGESMMAKRRSYATLISYLTPPFNESGARGLYTQLQTAIKNYFDQAGKPQQQQTALEVKRIAVQMGLHRDLRLDSTLSKPYSEADIERLDNFAEEIASEKVNASLYTTGQTYSPERIESTVLAMSVDPIAYSLAKLDQIRTNDKRDYTQNKRLFGEKYLRPATALVRQILAGKPVSSELICAYAHITPADLQAGEAVSAPKGGMMGRMKMGQGKTQIPHTMTKKHPEGKSEEPARGMPATHPEGGGKPNKADAKSGATTKAEHSSTETKSAGHPHSGGHPHATDAKNGADAKSGATAKSGQTAQGKPSEAMGTQQGTSVPTPALSSPETLRAIGELSQTIRNVTAYKEALLHSPQLELDGIINAFAGGYIVPSSGGDAVANPRAVPTGRNMYSVNAETTPSERAWSKGVTLVKETLSAYEKKHGHLPKKVSYTFWSSEFVETEGATIAQVLYMLGVEPVRDSFGRVSDLRLIPSEQLGRPRIDVVIQTSGQFRDLAASRLALITQAINLAASAPKEKEANYVAEGSVNTEKLLVEAGLSPKEARALSGQRIFGGINGMYGTGIQEMITAGDKWENEAEIAEVYLNNMGASYATLEDWGKYTKPLFRAALANTEMVIQPRQNNSWGALSLDHVYEFMGGLSLTIRNVTGKDPEAYFADYRNRNNFKIQDLKEAIGVESRSTVLNPAYIKEMLAGGASSLDRVTEVVTNTYGWNVAKPEVIDDELWNELYETYVTDKHHLGVQKAYESINPASMQEISAVMLETVRKGMWKASTEQVQNLSKLHASLTIKYGTVGGGFSSSNAKLQQFIQKNLPEVERKEYEHQINQMLGQGEEADKQGTVMTKEERQQTGNTTPAKTLNGLIIGGAILILFIILLLVLRRKRRKD